MSEKGDKRGHDAHAVNFLEILSQKIRCDRAMLCTSSKWCPSRHCELPLALYSSPPPPLKKCLLKPELVPRCVREGHAAACVREADARRKSALTMPFVIVRTRASGATVAGIY